MVQNRLKMKWFFSVSLVGVLANPLLAETLNSSATSLSYIEEIIVTARKREEPTEKAPVAVTSWSNDQIAEAGIVDLQDLALQTPGFSYREGFGRVFAEGNNRPVMRGMSSVLGEANAGFFIDGVYIAGPVSSFDLLNLDRVEVVKGPQSALFGRGAFGGAVNFVTKRPSDETISKVQGTVGTFGMIGVEGSVAGPIADGVSAELNGRFHRRGAMYDNSATGKKDLGEQESYRIGGKLNVQLGDNLNIYIHGGWAHDEDTGYAYASWNGGDAREGGVSDNQSNCFDPAVVRIIPGMSITRTLSRGYYCGEIKEPETFYSDFGGLKSVDRDIISIVSDISYNMASGSRITALTGYNHISYSQAELPAIFPGSSTIWEKGSQRYYSQELRYQSPTDSRFRYMVGGYYYRSDVGDTVNVSFNPLTQSLADKNLTLQQNGAYVKNQAVFGSFDLDIVEALTVTAEARYQNEKKILAGAAYDGFNKVSFSAFLPRFAVAWTATDTATFYGSVSRGVKPGGFNDDFYKTSLDADDRAYWRDNDRGSFEESSVWSYEVGTKIALNDTLSMNAAAFYLDWSGQQLTQSDALLRAGSTRQTTVTFITNAGKSEVKGVEFDIQWHPSSNFELRTAYAYNKATFKEYIDENWRDLQDTNGWYTGQAIAATIFPDTDGDGMPDIDGLPSLLPAGVVLDAGRSPIDSDGDGTPDRFYVTDTNDPDGQVAGNSLPQTPHHQVSVSGTYRFDVSSDLIGFIRTDYLYESKRYVQSANLSWVGDSHNVNVRIGLETENWSLTAWVENLTGDKTPEVATRYADFGNMMMIPSQVRAGSRVTFGRDFTVTAAAKRTFGLTYAMTF